MSAHPPCPADIHPPRSAREEPPFPRHPAALAEQQACHAHDGPPAPRPAARATAAPVQAVNSTLPRLADAPLRQTFETLQAMTIGRTRTLDSVAVVRADGSLSQSWSLIELPDADTVFDGCASKALSASRAWLQLGRAEEALRRHMMLLRIEAGGTAGYLMELQKRARHSADGYRFVERFSGLAFLMTDETRRRECAAFVASQTVRHRQILAHHYLSSPLLRRPRCFKHRAEEHGGARGALLIGLSKIGLIGLPPDAA